MKKRFLELSLLAGLGVMLVACGDDSGGDAGCDTGQVACDGVCIEEITPTLAGANGIQAAVFDGSCAFTSCHGSAGVPQAGLELSSVAVSGQQLIDVESTQVPTSVRVAPGDSGASYLMNKILGMNIAAGTQTMPIGGTLCDARIDAIEEWIDAGAPIQ
jgi:hypothetical protein